MGKWEESRFTKREQFSSASLVGLLSASGGIAGEVKTLDALLRASRVVVWFGSLPEKDVETTATVRAGQRDPVCPKRAMRTRADLLWWARERTPRLY